MGLGVGSIITYCFQFEPNCKTDRTKLSGFACRLATISGCNAIFYMNLQGTYNAFSHLMRNAH